IVTVPQIKSNLLMIYYAQNDAAMALPLLIDLLEVLKSDSKDSILTEKDEYRIYTLVSSLEAQGMIEVDDDEIDNAKSFLQESCVKIIELSPELPECKRELAVFIISSIPLVLQYGAITKEDQRLYLSALDRIRREYLVFPLDKMQMVILYYISALLSWNIGAPQTEKLFSLAVQSAEDAILLLPTKIAISASYASFLATTRKYNTAVFYVGKALSFIEALWKSCVRYLNDSRLIQILLPSQIQFTGCYALLRALEDTESRYERVLQFKALASLAGRERNRIIHSPYIDRKLLKSIKDTQDIIATLETENLFRDITNDYDTEKTKLRKLEALFAEKFPKSNEFVEISVDAVDKAIPDNCVVIEYFYCTLQYGEDQSDIALIEPEMGFDVFVTQKRNSKCHRYSFSIGDGEKITSAAEEFVEILQAESNNSATLEQMYKVNDLRSWIYNCLINPILPYIEGYETVYIAPDNNLINLPFEILYDDKQELLEDKYIVVKIECARDFLYKRNGEGAPEDNLIIGNPMYELREQELGERDACRKEHTRSINIDACKITPLPFTQIEVEKIGKYLKSICYTGKLASKYLLERNNSYQNIHIATHGYFDISNFDKSMYSSCLLFSGVCNWLKDGNINETYGNGIVTADEISRLDLKETELVVLSSCLSGMNDITVNKCFLGMIGAFSAAGVHYVITNLWEADDFSAAFDGCLLFLLQGKKEISSRGTVFSKELFKKYIR
ncbi:MAG: CHAT domain-containing protein, partial [Oscillospiraceae bacterium]|nr:CHAT domain-containing protein [Oscillospiraceae bacterium]